jgi:hypothetical protein
VEALLLQVAALNICPFQDRGYTEDLVGNEAIKSQDHKFLRTFCTATKGLMEMSTDLDKQNGWHLVDVVDGRIFFQYLKKIGGNGWAPLGIIAYAEVLHGKAVRGWDLDAREPFAKLSSMKGSSSSSQAANDLTALPFSHPVPEIS